MKAEDLAAPLLPTEPLGAAPAILKVDPAPSIRHGGRQLIERARNAIRARAAALPPELVRNSVELPAGSGYQSGLVATIRSRLLGGSLHVVTPRGITSPLDTAFASAGAEPVGGLRMGSGGGLRSRCTIKGNPALIRIGRAGTPADPTHHGRGLKAAADYPEVPDLLGAGSVADVSWCAESKVAGRTVRRIGSDRLLPIERFLRSMPQTDRVAIVRRAADSLTHKMDEDSTGISAAAEWAEQKLQHLPGAMIHGDFWRGNLLFRGDDLTGVIDWDGWAADGAPGTDLIHLFADDMRRRERTSYGAQVKERLWRQPELRPLLDRHLASCGLPHDDGTVDALGIAWWLTALANAVERNPDLLGNASWTGRNIGQPAADLARDLY